MGKPRGACGMKNPKAKAKCGAVLHGGPMPIRVRGAVAVRATALGAARWEHSRRWRGGRGHHADGGAGSRSGAHAMPWRPPTMGQEGPVARVGRARHGLPHDEQRLTRPAACVGGERSTGRAGGGRQARVATWRPEAGRASQGKQAGSSRQHGEEEGVRGAEERRATGVLVRGAGLTRCRGARPRWAKKAQ